MINLLFVEQLDVAKRETNIKERHCNLKTLKGIVIATYKMEINLYKLGIAIQCNQITTMPTISNINKIDLWHH
jgi:hypothetical protein